MTAPGEALAKAAQPKEQRNVLALIDRMLPEIEKALPKAIGAERLGRLVTTEIRRVPALLECTPESLLGAMMLSAQLGLEPGPLGHVYLVPWKEKGISVVQFIVGYRGMIDLARRSGQLKDVIARPVFEGEDFDYYVSDAGDRLKHRPRPPAERGPVVCYYGRARFAPSGGIVHVMYPEEIEARKNRSPAARKGAGPWTTDYQAMACKTVIRAMAPWLPLNPVAGRALAADELPVLGIDHEAEPIIELPTNGEEES